MKIKKLSIIQLSTVIILGLMVLAPMAVSADSPNQNPKIFPVHSKPYGLSYGDWMAKWWVWAFSMPIDNHPLYDTADCSEGNTDRHVWFLGSGFQTTQGPEDWVEVIKTRECTIPAGKAILIPVGNVEASTLEGDGVTYEELSEAAEGYQNAFTITSAEIDGRPVNLNNYRVQSPLFTFGPLPDNNILWNFGLEDATAGTTSESVADGVCLMVTPLSAGSHVIHFYAEVPDYKFRLDVTYNLVVLKDVEVE